MSPNPLPPFPQNNQINPLETDHCRKYWADFIVGFPEVRSVRAFKTSFMAVELYMLMVWIEGVGSRLLKKKSGVGSCSPN